MSVAGESRSRLGNRTYRARPERGHDDMVVGLEYFRDPSENRLPAMLTQPLRQPGARQQSLNSAAAR
jgi:hypothetical protein